MITSRICLSSRFLLTVKTDLPPYELAFASYAIVPPSVGSIASTWSLFLILGHCHPSLHVAFLATSSLLPLYVCGGAANGEFLVRAMIVELTMWLAPLHHRYLCIRYGMCIYAHYWTGTSEAPAGVRSYHVHEAVPRRLSIIQDDCYLQLNSMHHACYCHLSRCQSPSGIVRVSCQLRALVLLRDRPLQASLFAIRAHCRSTCSNRTRIGRLLIVFATASASYSYSRPDKGLLAP